MSANVCACALLIAGLTWVHVGCGGANKAAVTSFLPDRSTPRDETISSSVQEQKERETVVTPATRDEESENTEAIGDSDVDRVRKPGATTEHKKVQTALPTSRVRTFKTVTSRGAMSAYLVAPAQRAMKLRNYARAVALYRGIVASRGPGDTSAWELGRAWTLAEQPGAAIRVYEALAANTDAVALGRRAMGEAERLRNSPTPFQRTFRPRWARTEAIEAFKRGRTAFRRQRYADALVYFRMAAALDQSLDGPVREIGEAYRKLGAVKEGMQYYLDYLWRSPLGPFAEQIRRRLRGKRVLGSLHLRSKLPCDEVWVEGQLWKGKLPIKNLTFAPGYYRWLCVSNKYSIEYFDEVKIEANTATDFEFKWAVVVNSLSEPWGRIVIENPRSNRMVDLGVESRQLGVLVAKDERALKLQLKVPSGRIAEERFVRLQSGQIYEVKWKRLTHGTR